MFDKLEKIIKLFWLEGYRAFYDSSDEFVWINTDKGTFKIMEYDKESLIKVIDDVLESSYNKEKDKIIKESDINTYLGLSNIKSYIDEKLMLIDMRDELERM